MHPQGVEGVAFEFRHGAAVPLGVGRSEVPRQDLDFVRTALPKRRHVHLHYPYAVVQVLTELAFRHGLAEVAVGRTDDTSVGL